MSRILLPIAAHDPVVRIMWETCAHFTDKAQNSGPLAPLLLLLAEAFASLFGKLESIFLLWRAGALPPPPPARNPIRAPRPHACRTRAPRKHRTHARRRAPVLRQPCKSAPIPVASEPSPLRPNAPRPRVDRYPKPPETAVIADRLTATFLFRNRNKNPSQITASMPPST